MKFFPVIHSITAPALVSAAVILALVGLSAHSRAQSALTPEKAAAIARANNAELLAARHLIAEAEARTRTTGRLTNPELTFEVGAGPRSQARLGVAFTQRFPLTARLALERRHSAIAIEMARLELDDRARLIAGRARATATKLAAIRESVRLTATQTRDLETFAKSLTAQSAEGLTSSLAANQADLAAKTLAATSEVTKAEAIPLAEELATLLGRPPASFPNVVLAALPSQPPSPRTPTTRPDLRLAELAVEAGDTSVAIARASRWDDVGVGVFYEGERLAAEEGGFENENLAGVRVSIPLPLWQDGRGAVAEKTATLDRRRAELAALRLAVRNEADSAHRLLVAAFQTARTLETDLLPAARALVASSEAAYQRGEIDFPTLFSARTRLADAQTSALAARQSYHLAHAKWLTATEQ